MDAALLAAIVVEALKRESEASERVVDVLGRHAEAC